MLVFATRGRLLPGTAQCKAGVASETIADVWSSPSFPRLEAHKAKTRKHFTHLCLSPSHNAHLGRHFLVCSACPSTLRCPFSFALVPAFLKTSACRSPCLKETKGNPRTLDRVCHKRRCRPHYSRTCNPFDYTRIPARRSLLGSSGLSTLDPWSLSPC